MKTCSKCHIEKNDFSFYRSKSTKDGLRIYCKKCSTEERNKWRRKNKKINAQAAMMWYYKNIDKVKKLRKGRPQTSNESKKRSAQKSTKELSDGYIINIMSKRGFDRSFLKRYKSIIDVKREIIKIKRTIKNKQHGKN